MIENNKIETYKELLSLLVCACHNDKDMLAETYCRINPEINYKYFPEHSDNETIENMVEHCNDFFVYHGFFEREIKDFCSFFDYNIEQKGKLFLIESSMQKSMGSLIGSPMGNQSFEVLKRNIALTLKDLQCKRLIDENVTVEIIQDEQNNQGIINLTLKFNNGFNRL